MSNTTTLKKPSIVGSDETQVLIYMADLFRSFKDNKSLDNEKWLPLVDFGFFHIDRAKAIHEMFIFEGNYFEHHLGEDHFINFRISKDTLRTMNELFPRFFSQIFKNEKIKDNLNSWLYSS